MASQDDTPQQKPTPGGSAETEQDRAEQGADSGNGLSDASETIVSGDHAVGTAAAATAANSADAASSHTASSDTASTEGGAAAAAGTKTGDDGHGDWDAAFADAAGTPAAAAGTAAGEPRTPAGDDANVVPGGHPSLAQRSSLPMRRASTMPNLSGYADLTEEEERRAGDINAVVPSGSHAVERPGADGPAAARSSSTTGDPAAAPAAVPADAAPADAAPADAAGVTVPAASTTATAAVAGAGAAAASADAVPKTAQFSASEVKGSADEDPAARPAQAGSEADEATANEPGTDTTAEDELSAEEARRRAEERERAGTPKPVMARILQVMIALFFPVMLIAAAIRAVTTPLFLWIEYHRPGFPADGYGFSTDDRMTYGSYAVDYLVNFSGARYLGDLVTAGGEPLYLDSEVSHMADVKTVLTIAFVSALVMAVLSVLACVYLAKRSPGGIRRALFSGAVLTLVLVGALIVTAVLGWENFFTQVHTIFFANGNWTFRMDDTLIRLFPAQFWMDAGIGIAGLVLLTCIIVLVTAWPTKARRERARAKQEAARRRYLDSLEAV